MRAILRIAEGSLRAADLATRDLWRVKPTWSCREAHSRMAARDLDVAPLDEQPLRRYVVRDDLAEGGEGPAEQRARPIDATHLATADLALADALDLLQERSFLFVMEGGAVRGIITFADLQKVPVSMVLLSLILAAEAAMDLLILGAYGETSWLQHLSPGRRDSLEERYSALTAMSLEVTRIELLMLEDRLRLVGASESCRAALGFSSRAAFERWAERLKLLRNALAHGRTLLDVERDPHDAIDLVQKVRAFAERAWDAVERSGRPSR